jgi:hypothetical protein
MFARPLKPDIIKEDCKTVFYLVRGIPYGLMGLSSSIIIIAIHIIISASDCHYQIIIVLARYHWVSPAPPILLARKGDVSHRHLLHEDMMPLVGAENLGKSLTSFGWQLCSIRR